MTGQEMIQKASCLLGYIASNGNMQLSSRLASKSLDILNQIYSDLWRVCKKGFFLPLANVSVNIDLPERAINDVMPYGVAMLMAQSEEDSMQQQIYATLYNRKKIGLSRIETIKDVWPRSNDL